MTAPAPAPAPVPAPISDRIAALDILRGVAVMGILAANMPGFALPEAAYFSPRAWGGATGADLVAWFATFVLVEGKMRGLFAMLFGASMLLVVRRAEAAGDDPAGVHFRRMGWLFVIGLVHLYAVWWGDILTQYALVGCLAFLFRRASVRWLMILGVALTLLQTLAQVALWVAATTAAARNSPEAVATWAALSGGFGVPPASALATEIAANRGGYTQAFAWRWAHAIDPVTALPYAGMETLAYMLFGMAGLRSGFLTGAWTRARYRRWAVVTLGLTLPIHAALAWNTAAGGFDVRDVIFGSLVAATQIRPLTVAGYAAAILLLARPGGWLTGRIAAAGRVAFTNYLGTSVVMVALFQGAGLFGQVSRAGLYLIAAAMWVLMLSWSRPWLARHRFGPLEWVWRSLARWSPQPMRGPATTN